ncbi:putative ribonuclease H-like domain-containing protein [Tanacetum coccineum]
MLQFKLTLGSNSNQGFEVPKLIVNEVHGATNCQRNNINQKFLRSLPPSWNQIALIMRNKPDIDEIDIDEPHNNLSTNEVSTASGDFGVSTAGGTSQVPSTPCAHVYKVIIEDWNSDDEDDVSEVQTVSLVKTNESQTVKPRVDKISQTFQKQGIGFKKIKACFGNPEILLQDHAVVDSGCSSHMTGNKAYLSDYEDFNGGFVAFGSDPKGGKITGKGKIKTANLDFDDVYFVDELKFNLFYASQMCDKKNSVLFTESECLILSPSFKLLDESQVVLRAPRKDDVYSLDLKNIVPSGGITYLYANATADESKLWHRRLGYVNFKNINKLVKGHLVRGLPSKFFVNDHTCVACKKGKQHKASCKAKLDRIIRKPLELLHMDLFGPVSIESINKKRYCLVVTDDFSRFSWVFFLATKDESWVESMQEELLQFKLQQVWILVDLPFGKKEIGTKQEEGIDYDEVFAPIARIEAIRLFLAFTSYKGFLVYQIDVKSAFLYGTIKEEVYVYQPPGFVDPAHPNKVYKVVKALYGLHQAPRAWYETLSSFLLENGFRRGTIDKTLFIKKNKSDIMLVQM